MKRLQRQANQANSIVWKQTGIVCMTGKLSRFELWRLLWLARGYRPAQSNWVALLLLLNMLWKWRDSGGLSRIWSCIMQDTESARSLSSCGGTVCSVQLRCGPMSTWCGLLYVFTAKKPLSAGLGWKCILEHGIGDCGWSIAWAQGFLSAPTRCCLCCWSDGGKPEVLAWGEPRGSPQNTCDMPLSSPFQNSSVLSPSNVTRSRV